VEFHHSGNFLTAYRTSQDSSHDVSQQLISVYSTVLRKEKFIELVFLNQSAVDYALSILVATCIWDLAISTRVLRRVLLPSTGVFWTADNNTPVTSTSPATAGLLCFNWSGVWLNRHKMRDKYAEQRINTNFLFNHGGEPVEILQRLK
jgi:hypothetical protein